MKNRTSYILMFVVLMLLAGCNNFYSVKNERVDFDLNNKIPIGDKSASNTVVVFQDYGCDECKGMFDAINDGLADEINDGVSNIYFYNLGFTNEQSYVKSLLLMYFEKHHENEYIELLNRLWEMDSTESLKFKDDNFVREWLSQSFPKLDADKIVLSLFKNNQELKTEYEKMKKFTVENQVEVVPTVFVNGLKVQGNEIKDIRENLRF